MLGMQGLLIHKKGLRVQFDLGNWKFPFRVQQIILGKDGCKHSWRRTPLWMKTQHSNNFPPRRFYSFYCPCCRVVIFMEKRTVRKLITDPTWSFYFQLISGMWIPLSYQGLPETEAFIDLVNEIMPPLKKGYTK